MAPTFNFKCLANAGGYYPDNSHVNYGDFVLGESKRSPTGQE